jgi:hypothetical protein
VLILHDSHVLQQPPHDPSPPRRIPLLRGLVLGQPSKELPRASPQSNRLRNDPLRPLDRLHLIHVGLVRACHIIHNIQHGGCIEQAAHCHFGIRLLRRTRHLRQRQRHLRRLRERARVRVGQGQAGREQEPELTHDEPHHQRQQSEFEGWAKGLSFAAAAIPPLPTFVFSTKKSRLLSGWGSRVLFPKQEMEATPPLVLQPYLSVPHFAVILLVCTF